MMLKLTLLDHIRCVLTPEMDATPQMKSLGTALAAHVWLEAKMLVICLKIAIV